MAERTAATTKAPEAKQTCPNSCMQNPIFNSTGSPAERILQLQRTAGNQAVQRLIKSRALQAKLRIGQPNDIYEQEADRVAEQIIRIPDPAFVTQSPVNSRPKKLSIQSATRYPEKNIQRKEYGGEEEGIFQMKQGSPPYAADSQLGVPPSVYEVLSSPGHPLDQATRAFMEPRFGRDFSSIRVHSGLAAEQSAREMNAHAYTVGYDIVFGSGRFTSETYEGRKLIAHELTHVVHQRGEGSVGQLQPAVISPGDAGEREADAGTDKVIRHNSIPSLSQEFLTVQRKCQAAELGAPIHDCIPSQQGVAGWQLMFKIGCYELLPGEESKIYKLKTGSQLRIHGFASREGDPRFNDDLSCHRANKVAQLVQSQRADCFITGTFKHGASPVSAAGVIPDVNPQDFWRSVIIEETKPPLESGESWFDPARFINTGWALYNRALANPIRINLDSIAKTRVNLMFWLEETPKNLAPPGAELSRRNLDDYRRFYASAERLWTAIDQLLAVQKHPEAAKNTYYGWAKGTGIEEQKYMHAKDVPTGARYHVDIFGEGYFKGAINIGESKRTSTTGVFGTRVPNLIYRHFSKKDARLPIADHVADLVTSESGPIGIPGLAEEIARIIAPGGVIVIYGPEKYEADHDKVAKATGGTVKKERFEIGKCYGQDDCTRALQTTIVVPGP